MKGRELVKKEETSKKTYAIAAVALTTASALLISPWMLILGIPVSLVFVYQWFRFRAINGLRF